MNNRANNALQPTAASVRLQRLSLFVSLHCKVASKIDPQVATNIDPAGKFIRLKYQIKYIARGGAKLMQLMGQNG